MVTEPGETVDGTSRDEVVAVITARAPDRLFGGTVHAVIPRGDVFVVVVSHRRSDGEVSVPFAWPDSDLEGESTGEPTASLDAWASEVGMVLDEMFDTEPSGNLNGELDPETGYSVIGLRRFLRDS